MLTNNNIIHQPVLLNEAINLLNIKNNGIYIDATSGFGGHSLAILNKLNNEGRLICIDADKDAFNYLNNFFKNEKRVIVINDNFKNITKILNNLKIEKVDGIIADLGVSSWMLDESKRGFSYHNEAKLDMRMNQNQKLSAYEIINFYSIKELEDIFKKFGESKYAFNVAKAIANERKNKSIETTTQLVNIIKASLPYQIICKHKHPAKIYFQAIRIAVNDELNNLKTFINQASKLLSHQGVLAIISFHSLEDRIVKKAFLSLINDNFPIELPIQVKKEFALLNKHPIIPSEKEVNSNYRAHSAKLRGIVRI